MNNLNTNSNPDPTETATTSTSDLETGLLKNNNHNNQQGKIHHSSSRSLNNNSNSQATKDSSRSIPTSTQKESTRSVEQSNRLIIQKRRPKLHRENEFLPPGLNLFVYRIDHAHTERGGNLVDADLDDAIARRHTTASYWIDAHVHTAVDHPRDTNVDDHSRHPTDIAELQELVARITHKTPFLRRHLAAGHMMEQLQTPQVLTLTSSMFLVMRVLPQEDDDSHDPRCVAALAMDRLLLTVTTSKSQPQQSKEATTKNDQDQPQDVHPHHRRSMALLLTSRTFTTRSSSLLEDRELPEASVSGALALWLLCHTQQVAKTLAQTRKACFAMDQELDDNVEEMQLESIVLLKNTVNQLIAVSEEQLECVENVKEGQEMSQGVDFEKLRGSIGLVLATAGANERLAQRLERKVTDIRHSYDANQQDRINKRLEVLTILSAIFLPLTLMAGIWGMNFSNMPETQTEHGYFLALTGMLCMALILVFIFYRFGWLR